MTQTGILPPRMLSYLKRVLSPLREAYLIADSSRMIFRFLCSSQLFCFTTRRAFTNVSTQLISHKSM